MSGPSLRERAIRHLARREHSSAELARKLADHGSAEEIDDTLTRMTELGLLSDPRFAEAWVRGKASRFGAVRLRAELARRGIDRDTADEALAGCAETEQARACAVWRAKFGVPPADAREWARQARFLQTRGFSSETIRALLKAPLTALLTGLPDESA